MRKAAIRQVLACATASVALISGGALNAQNADAPDENLDNENVILVTATKSGGTLEDTAAAVSVVGAADIGPGGIQNISDLSTAIPGVSVGDQFGVNRTFIRGIGLTSIDLGADGAVAFLQNGAIISRPSAQLSGFYDLEQVEVLRGPQGTTYGRGATAGVVNLVTARPTSDLSGYARATYGNFDAITLEGAVGGGLTDGVMARLSGKLEQRDGFGTNLFTGNDVDDRDAWAVRGSVLFEPTPDLEVLVVGDYFREDDNNYAFHYFGPTIVPEANLASSLLGGQTIFGFAQDQGFTPNPRDIYSDQDAVNDREGYSAQANITWDSGDLTISSTTAYRQFERFNRNDLDASQIDAFGQNNYTEDSESFSQELNFTYDAGALQLLGGAMYFNEDLFGEVRVPTTNLAAFFNITLGTNLPDDLFDNGNFLQRGTVETDAFGGYLEGSFELAPSLVVTAGARYNYERRTGVGRFTFEAQNLDVPTDNEASWDAITPKFAVEYTTDGGTLIYARITRGFKSGVINIGSVNPVINPEFVWSYEAGVRGETADGTLGFAGTAFYYDYTDLQVGFVNANNIVETINAAAARNYGVELEATLRPGPDTTFRLFGTYLNAKYKDFCNGYYAAGDATRRQFPACPDGSSAVDLSGNRLSNAPEFSVAAFADHRIDLGDSGFVDLSADANLQSEVFFTEFNNRDARQESFVQVNASVTWRSADERLSVSAWGRNLTDQFAVANTIITAPLFSFVSVGSLRPPRTYGLTLGFDF